MVDEPAVDTENTMQSLELLKSCSKAKDMSKNSNTIPDGKLNKTEEFEVVKKSVDNTVNSEDAAKAKIKKKVCWKRTNKLKEIKYFEVPDYQDSYEKEKFSWTRDKATGTDPP